MSTLEMRRLGSANFAELQRVLEEAPGYAFLQTGEGPTPEDAKSIFASFPPGRGVEDKFVLGFFLNRRMLGCADLIRAYPDSKTAMLGLLLISEQHQRRGLGREAFRCIENIALEWAGCEKIRIGVTGTNEKAFAFWRALGFQDTGVRKPYSHGSVVSETHVFEKAVT